MISQDFKKDFIYMTKRIFIQKKPTAFVRYNEGECGLLIDNGFIGAKGLWRTYKEKQKLRKELIRAIRYKHNDFFYGIATIQHLWANERYKKYINCENITYATLFVNANWDMFKEIIKTIKEEVIIIGNENGKGKQYPFEVRNYISIPNDVVSYFEHNEDEVKEKIKEVNRNNNRLVFFSCGPLANYMIYKCWIKNKTNRLIDMGSTLDLYIHGQPTRKYYFNNSKTHNQIDKLF